METKTVVVSHTDSVTKQDMLEKLQKVSLVKHQPPELLLILYLILYLMCFDWT